MRTREGKVRFAVVGLGHIAQNAVLPAFSHASRWCELAALISSDRSKRSEIGKRYGIEHVGSYEELERVFDAARVDAAYIALPNSHHRAFTERCARAGVHVLCEKPMATTADECDAMIAACDENRVKLMIAYRLHFERANLRAIEVAQSGRIGEPLFFSSTLAHQVREGNIRTKAELGGGALFDMGVYCINAARALFRAEPEEVFGYQSRGHDARFRGVDATTTALLRFSGDRFAQITASQAAADSDQYRLIGTRGELRLEPAFTYHEEMSHYVLEGGKTRVQKFPKSDQFAPELIHFAECVVNDAEPEPSGEEGLADVRIMEAIVQSAESARPIRLSPFSRAKRPSRALESRKPPVGHARLVNASPPSK